MAPTAQYVFSPEVLFQPFGDETAHALARFLYVDLRGTVTDGGARRHFTTPSQPLAASAILQSTTTI